MKSLAHLKLLITLTAVGSQAFSLLSMSSSGGVRPYCVNLKCTVQPSRRADFVSLIQNNQRLTLGNEPKALQYVVGEDVSDRNTFYIHEQFTDVAGFAAHRDMPHNSAWQEFKNSNPFAENGEPIVYFFHGTHEPENVPIRDAYCLNVKLCIEQNVRDEFLAVIENNARGSNQDEKLCLQYIWGEDVNEPNTFHFHEQYTGSDGGKEGFDAHAATEHFGRWAAFEATDPFTKPPEVNFYRTLPN